MHREWSWPYAGLAASSNDLHDDPPDVLPHPLVEDGAQEDAERFSRHGARAHAALGSRLLLHKRDEADVLGVDLLEETVHLEGMPDVLGMHDTQEIDRDLMFAQEPIALHHLPVRGLPVLGHAIDVVQCRRTVEAEPDAKMFSRKKAAPVVVKEYAVRLDAVGDTPIGRKVFALEPGYLAEIVYPEHGRLAAVPEEIDRPFRGDCDLLADVLLQQIVGHAKRLAVRVEQVFVQVVTVVAIEVAGGPCRFCKDLEFP